MLQAARPLVEALQATAPVTLPIGSEQIARLAAEETTLRNRQGVLAAELATIPQGDEAAAQTLARLAAIEQERAAATTAADRRQLSERRDELLAETTPEQLRAAAAPLERRRVLGAEQESIVARLAEIERERGPLPLIGMIANIGQRSVIPYSLSELAERQRDLQRAGSVPGMNQRELAAANEAIYGAKAAAPVIPPLAAGSGRAAATMQATVDAAVAQAAKRPIVETPMPSGANSSRDLNGPVYVDPSVPEELRGPVAVHETVEQTLMAQGVPYPASHEAATAAERRAVEAAGMDWRHYTAQWDGLLAHIEKTPVDRATLPDDLHVDPEAAIGHHRAANKEGYADVRNIPFETGERAAIAGEAGARPGAQEAVGAGELAREAGGAPGEAAGTGADFPVTEEDQAMLRAARAETEDAEAKAQSYLQAGQCLAGLI